MNDLIDKIIGLENEIGQLSPIKPEWQKKLDEKFRLEFSYNSNHMEGNTLTYGETKMLFLFDKTQGNHELREYEEMSAHDVAFQLIKDWAADKDRHLTEKDIKELNETILVKPFWKEAETEDGNPTRRKIDVGTYKKFPNSVRLSSGKIFEYASVQDTPIEMGELMKWYTDLAQSELDKIKAVELASILHYKFVRIHPFDDGNGRVARLLMNYVLIRNGLPPVVIKSEHKKEYLFALQQADSGLLGKFVEYIAEQVVWSLEIVSKATKGEDLEEQGDLDKKIELLKREERIKKPENEIQKSLSPVIIKECLEFWGYELLEKLSKTTVKFNEFYSDPKHSVSLNIGSRNSPNIDFFNKLDLQASKKIFGDFLINSEFDGAIIKFHSWFGVYKYGGIEPFGCGYDLKIKFDKYTYEVSYGYFDTENKSSNRPKIFKKQLLHQHLATEDIDLLNKKWGDSLYDHLVYHKSQLK